MAFMIGTPVSTRSMEGQYRCGAMLAPAHRAALICIKGIRSALPQIADAHAFHAASAGDRASASGTLRRAERPDFACRPQDNGGSCAGQLVIAPGIGHSMNLELPALCVGYFGAWFGGIAKSTAPK
jgi:hypothetical protein